MSEDHEKYRPRSPDLSAFAPPPPASVTRQPSYHIPDSSNPGYSFSPRGSYDASPYFSPQVPSSTSYFASQPYSGTPQTYSPQAYRTPAVSEANQGAYSTDSYQNFHQAPQLNQPRFPSQPVVYPAGFQQTQYQGDLQQYSDMARTRQKPVAQPLDNNYHPETTAPLPPTASQGTHGPGGANRHHEIEVKTKFPVARIKRIMQADEDVGKVAQATPTAVSKALELFMITLVGKGADEAKAQNSKRVTAQHLKMGLMKDPTFDFLAEICENVPDEASKKGRAKSEAKSEDSDDGEPQRRKGKGGRKRKAESDEESD